MPKTKTAVVAVAEKSAPKVKPPKEHTGNGRKHMAAVPTPAKSANTPKVKAESNGHVATPEEKTPRAKKGGGLSGGARKILAVLANLRPNAGGLTKPEIAAKAGMNLAFCGDLIGGFDPVKRAARDAARSPCLITRGLVQVDQNKADGEPLTWLVKITASGREAIKSATKAGK